MKSWAKEFYQSKAWKAVRRYIYIRDCGLCVRCGDPGEIAHHKEHLTQENITDPYIALGEDNLELVCRKCHAIEHEGEQPTDSDLMFDSEGNLIERILRYE